MKHKIEVYENFAFIYGSFTGAALALLFYWAADKVPRLIDAFLFYVLGIILTILYGLYIKRGKTRQNG